MRSSNMGLFAIAAAIAFVGALWADVPLAGLAMVMIFLACPLTMIFMMKDMHAGGRDSEHRDTDEPHDRHLRH